VQEAFSEISRNVHDACTKCFWPQAICGMWLATRLNVAGEVIQLATALFLAATTKNASLAGLALTTAGKLTRALL
jgi:hypothetical protein